MCWSYLILIIVPMTNYARDNETISDKISDEYKSAYNSNVV